MKLNSTGKCLVVLIAVCMLLAVSVIAQEQEPKNGQPKGPRDDRPQGAAFSKGVTGRNVCRGAIWVEPTKAEPAGTHYKLYPTPSRGPNTEASYLIYLPPDYETAKTRRYPVYYYLHGGGQDQVAGAWMVEKAGEEMRAGKIPPFIMVLPQALPDVRYFNTKDGTRPLEDVMIKDLVPHIDKTYRTIADRKARAIEGFSMGGFGTLRLGFKFSELFGTVSGLAPSITDMKDEPECIGAEPVSGDQAYYDEVGPWNQVKKNADAIRGRTNVRLFVGDKDGLLPLVTKYHELMTSLKIEHQFVVASPDVYHSDRQIFSKLPFDGLAFWKDVFGRLKY
jgi:enterochelin esterase-like enzyme